MPFTRVIKSRLPLLVSALLLFPVLETKAQDALPDLPPAIQTLVDQGAQIRYLGKDFGVEGWVAIKNGQEQFFYVLPGQGAFISGLLVDGKGKVVTIEQVARLRQQGDDILDKLSGSAEETAAAKVEEFNYNCLALKNSLLKSIVLNSNCLSLKFWKYIPKSLSYLS